jgi:hypothetical protein
MPQAFSRKISTQAGRLNNWPKGDADFPFADIAVVFDIDKFHFAMSGRHDLRVMNRQFYAGYTIFVCYT